MVWVERGFWHTHDMIKDNPLWYFLLFSILFIFVCVFMGLYNAEMLSFTDALVFTIVMLFAITVITFLIVGALLI